MDVDNASSIAASIAAGPVMPATAAAFMRRVLVGEPREYIATQEG